MKTIKVRPILVDSKGHCLSILPNKEPIICPHCGKYKRLQGNGVLHQLCMCKDLKPIITYTEEEVKELLIKRCKEFSTQNEPFNKLLLKQDLDWFDNNKKK